MKNLIQQINKKVNCVILSLIGTGIILILLAALIIWTDYMLRIVFGLIVLTIAYMFIYGGYKVWHIKKEVETPSLSTASVLYESAPNKLL